MIEIDLPLSPIDLAGLLQPAPQTPMAEHHLLAAGLNVSEIRWRSHELLTKLLTNPRDEGAIMAALVDIQDALTRAGGSFRAFAEVRSCAGSA